MPSSLRQETKLLMIFSHQTQHFLHFLACCACANLFIHGMATDLMAKAEVSPTAILPIHSKIAAHLSATYWWTRLTMICTAHYYSTGWKEEAAQPDPAKDFDFTLNLIALRAIAASRLQTTHHPRQWECSTCSTFILLGLTSFMSYLLQDQAENEKDTRLAGEKTLPKRREDGMLMKSLPMPPSSKSHHNIAIRSITYRRSAVWSSGEIETHVLRSCVMPFNEWNSIMRR